MKESFLMLVPALVYYCMRKRYEASVYQSLSVLVGRYFGSAEGSKFVEMASVDNVKRTWVNYGVAREWSDPTQGQVGRREGVWLQLTQCMKIQSLLKAVERMASSNPALSLVPLTQGEEFLYHATEVKNIWLPMGEIFAN